MAPFHPCHPAVIAPCWCLAPPFSSVSRVPWCCHPTIALIDDTVYFCQKNSHDTTCLLDCPLLLAPCRMVCCTARTSPIIASYQRASDLPLHQRTVPTHPQSTSSLTPRRDMHGVVMPTTTWRNYSEGARMKEGEQNNVFVAHL